MSAQTVAQRLPVLPSAYVLEVGSGSGYYSIEVAKKIPQGKLVLLDIQAEMLKKSRDKLKEAGISNFQTKQADGKVLPFEENSFDAVFMVTVFGEIEERSSFLKEAARVLKPKGVLSITEHHPDPDFESAEKVLESISSAGFTPLQKLGWCWAYTCNAANTKARED